MRLASCNSYLPHPSSFRPESPVNLPCPPPPSSPVTSPHASPYTSPSSFLKRPRHALSPSRSMPAFRSLPPVANVLSKRSHSRRSCTPTASNGRAAVAAVASGLANNPASSRGNHGLCGSSGNGFVGTGLVRAKRAVWSQHDLALLADVHLASALVQTAQSRAESRAGDPLLHTFPDSHQCYDSVSSCFSRCHRDSTDESDRFEPLKTAHNIQTSSSCDSSVTDPVLNDDFRPSSSHVSSADSASLVSSPPTVCPNQLSSQLVTLTL